MRLGLAAVKLERHFTAPDGFYRVRTSLATYPTRERVTAAVEQAKIGY